MPEGSLTRDVQELSKDEIRLLEPGVFYYTLEADMMRGVNYGTDCNKGIALLVAKGFSSRRGYIQALGRVGRNAEPCARYLLEGVDEVDKELRLELVRSIFALHKKTAPQRKTKEHKRLSTGQSGQEATTATSRSTAISTDLQLAQQLGGLLSSELPTARLQGSNPKGLPIKPSTKETKNERPAQWLNGPFKK